MKPTSQTWKLLVSMPQNSRVFSISFSSGHGVSEDRGCEQTVARVARLTDGLSGSQAVIPMQQVLRAALARLNYSSQLNGNSSPICLEIKGRILPRDGSALTANTPRGLSKHRRKRSLPFARRSNLLPCSGGMAYLGES